jgi:DNA-directed RNA polymerase specialized sigma24 family protein
VATGGVEELLANRELAQHIIARMPADLCAVAFLHYVDGLDQGEVATLLGISRRTVGSRVAEFLRRARDFVKREQP